MPVGSRNVKKTAGKSTDQTVGQASSATVNSKEAVAENSSVKSAVLSGANPNLEFYHILDDLPIHLL